MASLSLVTEDALSAAIGDRLIAEAGGKLEVVERLGQRGAGHLRARFRQWCEIGRQRSVLLITDLDQGKCAPSLIRSWSRNDARPAGLVFRVAVREVESWILADGSGVSAYLGVSRNLIPRNPDELPDPKERLLRIALRGRRDLRSDLVAEPGAIASQGLGYNVRLVEFVRDRWSPDRAATVSPSLARARQRIREAAEAA